MAGLRLTLACDSYDYLQPLQDGRMLAEGIDLTVTIVESGLRHRRMYQDRAYDACEFSMSTYLSARAARIDWLQAIPFFPRRMFGHQFCFLRRETSVTKPSDLRGHRVGLRSYQNTLALMVKGMFMHDYGLPLDAVTWVCVNDDLVPTARPATVTVEHASGEQLERLLTAGEIDAAVEPDLPGAWLRREGALMRLFPAFEQDEKEYYARTRIFPIMHVVVIKEDILSREPWVAASLFEALTGRQRAHREWMQQPHRMSFAWARSYLEEERAFFDREPFVQGLQENRHDIQTMIRFAQEQGLLARPLTADELFVETTRDT